MLLQICIVKNLKLAHVSFFYWLSQSMIWQAKKHGLKKNGKTGKKKSDVDNKSLF